MMNIALGASAACLIWLAIIIPLYRASIPRGNAERMFVDPDGRRAPDDKCHR